jgi:hypothetical protein
MAQSTKLRLNLPSYGSIYQVMAQSTKLWLNLPSYGSIYQVMAQSTKLWLNLPSYGSIYQAMAQSSKLWFNLPSYGSIYQAMAQSTKLWFNLPSYGSIYQVSYRLWLQTINIASSLRRKEYISGVKVLNGLAVLLHDDMPLHLERGAQLPAGHAKVLGQHAPLLNLLRV